MPPGSPWGPQGWGCRQKEHGSLLPPPALPRAELAGRALGSREGHGAGAGALSGASV